MKVNLGGYVNRHSKGSKLKRLMWEIVWALLVRTTPRWCLNGWRVFWLRRFGAKVGKNCVLRNSFECWRPDNLTMGDNCWIDSQARIYSADKIVMASNCVVSARAFLCTATHDVRSEIFELTTAPIVLEDYVWVASDAIVLPGITLHEGCVVGAGAVVTKDVEPWKIVGGNPARVIGERKIREVGSEPKAVS